MNKKEKAAQMPTVTAVDGQLSQNFYNNIIPYSILECNITKVKYFSEIEATSVDWLWYPYIPFGKITIIQGDPGDGKTTLALNIAAMLSRGEKLPTELEYTYNFDHITTIYQTAEDGLADTIKPRLVAANADCCRICTIIEESDALHFSDKRIENTIVSTGAKLLIMDPIQAYLGANVDMHRANEVRPVMAKLEEIAEKHSCSILLIGHMNKSGKKAKYKGLGSIDITAAARSVLYVGRLDGDKNKRCLIPIKSNLAPEGRAVIFSINDQITWLGFDNININDICTDLPQKNNKKSKVDIAEDMLKSLFENEGTIKKDTIDKAREDHGIKNRVLETAKRNLNIQSLKIGDCWYWQLPK